MLCTKKHDQRKLPSTPARSLGKELLARVQSEGWALWAPFDGGGGWIRLPQRERAGVLPPICERIRKAKGSTQAVSPYL